MQKLDAKDQKEQLISRRKMKVDEILQGKAVAITTSDCLAQSPSPGAGEQPTALKS